MNQTLKTRPLTWTGATSFGIIAADLDATVQFYHDVLDMEPGPIMDGTELFERHCFLKLAGTEVDVSLHVIEHPQAIRINAGLPLVAFENQDDYAAQGGVIETSMPLNYFGLVLADQAMGEALRSRLIEHGVECTRPIDRGPVFELIFQDNNGMMISARWAKEV